MTETDDGLVCDACTRGHNVPEESAVVAFDNWRDAALQAIRELPEELQTSIGHSFNSDHSMLISVACEPDSDSYDEGRESSIATVHIRYQDSIWDQGRPVTEEEATSGSANYWASISVEANDTLDEFQGKFKCDRDLLMDFVRTVQTAILETMWSGGGMIDKDRKRRYFLPNGKRILDWK